MIDKIKTISKYVVNALVALNALLVGLDPIWNFPTVVDQISGSTLVVAGILGAYLLADKGYHTITGK